MIEIELEPAHVFESIDEAVIVVDHQRGIRMMNSAAKKLFRLFPLPTSLDQINAAYDLRTLAGESVSVELRPFAAASRRSFIFHARYELHGYGEDHSILVEVNSTPWLGAQGQTLGAVLVIRDVTEISALEQSARLLASVVESSEDAIIAEDLSGVIKSWNSAASEMFGYAPQEMIGQSIKAIIPEELYPEGDSFLARLLAGERIACFQTERIRKDGVRINVSVTISPICNSHGKIIGASKIVRDVTALKKVNQHLQLNATMEAVGRLAGGIAHDGNNILAAAIGNLELLERLISDQPEAMRRLEIAKRAAGRGTELMKKLLSLAFQQEVRPELVQVSSAVEAVVDLARCTGGREKQIAVHMEKGLSPILVEPSALERTLLNLIINSFDAMPDGGTVTISGSSQVLTSSHPLVMSGSLQSGAYICLDVADTGKGIPRHILDRVIEPLFTTKPSGKGTGLGLSYAFGFAKRSHGELRIYSEVGVGTKIKIYLPCSAAGKRETVNDEKVSCESHHGIALIVDDEEDLRQICKVYLEEMGYTVLAANDGVEAEEIFRHRPEIDLLVTDVIMPHVNGPELACRARQLLPHITIVFISGFTSGELAGSCSIAADALLIEKPFQKSTFQRTIDQAVAR